MRGRVRRGSGARRTCKGQTSMATFFRGHGERQGEPTRGAVPRSDQDVRQFLRLLPRYRVLLYAGPDLAIGHAVEALLGTVPALTEDEAVEVVAQAQALG